MEVDAESYNKTRKGRAASRRKQNTDLILPVLGQCTGDGDICGAEAEANKVEDGVLIRHIPKKMK